MCFPIEDFELEVLILDNVIDIETPMKTASNISVLSKQQTSYINDMFNSLLKQRNAYSPK